MLMSSDNWNDWSTQWISMEFSDALLFNFKDDIGDKSVFMFKSLPDDEKKALIESLEQQN